MSGVITSTLGVSAACIYLQNGTKPFSNCVLNANPNVQSFSHDHSKRMHAIRTGQREKDWESILASVQNGGIHAVSAQLNYGIEYVRKHWPMD